MATSVKTRQLLSGVALAVTISLAGCVYGPYDSHARVGVHGYYDTAYDDFYFYPDVSVYFGINSGLYYYRPHDHWVGVHALPPGIKLKRDRRVELKRLPKERPYDHYRDHYDRYRRH